ncbi:unnamed protein product [Phytomonas sp. EM1]|nr:unnamed protein product [Phytomonas sp. EM1]|eukprot:CCW62557.1 unnamed protein product [Phytomonas sp. isolate EM1]
MLRRLNARLPCAAAASFYQSHSAAFFSTGTSRFMRFPLAKRATLAGLGGSSAFRAFTTPSRPSFIHVRGGEIRRRDTPMTWDGTPSRGSEADSLTPYVREHLTRVYTLLATGCVAAGLGSLLMIATPLAKVIPFWMPMVGGFIPLLWLSFAPPANPGLKIALFYAFTLLEGMAIAPLVLMTAAKGVLTTSLVLTAAVFFGFSAAAYLAPRASLVAWQGPLYGALIGMVAISVLNIFYPTAIVHSIILYGGLALFSIMISSDTQMMIERARCGAGDHVQDALRMFMNVINIFIRIAQIMGSMNR